MADTCGPQSGGRQPGAEADDVEQQQQEQQEQEQEQQEQEQEQQEKEEEEEEEEEGRVAVFSLQTGRLFRAVQGVYILICVYALATACSDTDSASGGVCSPLGTLSGSGVALGAVLHSGLLVGAAVSPRIESLIVVWALFPVALFQTLAIQLILTGAMLGMPGTVSPASLVLTSRTPMGLLSSNLFALLLPLLATAVAVAANWQLYALYWYQAYAAVPFGPSHMLTNLYQMSMPVAAVALWYAVARTDGWLASDVHAWPGLGSMLLYSALAYVPMFLLCRIPVASLYGRIVWNVYGRSGIAFLHNEATHTAEPVVFMSQQAQASQPLYT